jgi:hypothetical protein
MEKIRRAGVPVLATTIVAVLVVGVAAASIPDSDGIVHGCRNNRTGVLRVVDSASQQCTSKESPLNWNQTGPVGPAGPSDGYFTRVGTVRQSFSTTDYSTVGSLNLPAGSYVVWAKARVSGPTLRNMDCELHDGTTQIDRVVVVAPSGTIDTEVEPSGEVIALNVGTTLNASGAVGMRCRDNRNGDIADGEGYVFHITMSAIRVGTLHDQSD